MIDLEGAESGDVDPMRRAAGANSKRTGTPPYGQGGVRVDGWTAGGPAAGGPGVRETSPPASSDENSPKDADRKQIFVENFVDANFIYSLSS